MLLLLTLVYLFHNFQTHATPLTSRILTESVETAVLSSTPTCVCPAVQRSIWDILWSALATIFACSWVSVHPNIPAPDESEWRIFLRRIELMFWAVIGPELIIVWAFRQWLGARHIEKLYKGRDWTKTHGYFIQMGGFMLFEGNLAKGVLSPKMFSELLSAGKIEFPAVIVEEIEDRSKGDGLSKTIAIGQTLWFIAQCIARRAQNLDITLIELLTLSLAVLNGVMYFLWWHKPLDVRSPIRVQYLLDKPKESKDFNELCEPNDPNKSSHLSESHESNNPNSANKSSNHNHNKSNIPNKYDNLYYKTLFANSEVTRETEMSPEIAVPSSPKILQIAGQWMAIISDWVSLPRPALVKAIIWITIVFPLFIVGGIALFIFVLGCILVFVVGILIVLPIWSLGHLTMRWIYIMLNRGDFNTGDMKVPTFYSYELEDREERASLLYVAAAGVVFGGIHCAGWFSTFPSSAEAILWRVCSVLLTGTALFLPLYRFVQSKFEVSHKAELSVPSVIGGLSIIVAITVYTLSRLLLLVEAFISLRHLPPGMLGVVKWASFIPHV